MIVIPAGITRTPELVRAEHQLVLCHPQPPWPRHHIGLSCACLGCHGNGRGRKLIESRALFPAAEALTAWRAWHELNGVAV